MQDQIAAFNHRPAVRLFGATQWEGEVGRPLTSVRVTQPLQLTWGDSEQSQARVGKKWGISRKYQSPCSCYLGAALSPSSNTPPHCHAQQLLWLTRNSFSQYLHWVLVSDNASSHYAVLFLGSILLPALKKPRSCSQLCPRAFIGSSPPVL